MNISNLLKVALQAIVKNKMRSFLTMLGIIIGVAAVIAMLGIGEGSKKSIETQISEMGANMIMIRPYDAESTGGVRMSGSNIQTMKNKDYEDIKLYAKCVEDVSPNVTSSGQFIYQNNNYPSSITGVASSYLNIRQLRIESGYMFTETDIQHNNKVAVVEIGRAHV